MRTTLDRLQSQLDELREIDPAVAARLQENIDQAKQVLARREPQGTGHATVVEQLNDAVLELEASHPTLAQNLGGLIDALGRMGI
jgi:hypothetical protein